MKPCASSGSAIDVERHAPPIMPCPIGTVTSAEKVAKRSPRALSAAQPDAVAALAAPRMRRAARRERGFIDLQPAGYGATKEFSRRRSRLSHHVAARPYSKHLRKRSPRIH